MDWIYKDSFLLEPPKGYIGFCYIITHLSSNKKYIGRKMFYDTAYKTSKGKRTKFKKENNWKEYWSSSKEIQDLVLKEGVNNFKREILILLKTKSEMLYVEENLLHSMDVLTKDDWFNSNIRTKLFKSWFKNKDVIDELYQIKSKLNPHI